MSRVVYGDAARKLRAETALAEENLKKARLERVRSTAALLVSACVAFGVFTVFCYCEYQANFFPSGLNVGDTLFFVFVALGFGAIYLIWLYLGYLAIRGTASLVIWFRSRSGRPRGPRAEIPDSGIETVWLVVAVLCAWLALGGIAWFANSSESRCWQVVAGFVPPLIGGWSFWLLLDSRGMQPSHTRLNRADFAKFRILFLAIGLGAPMFFALTITAAMQRAALRNLGIYSERAAVIASEEEFKAINATAQRLEIAVFGCNVDGTDKHMVSGIRLWWSGIGDRVLIGIPDPSQPGKDAARIELKRDEVRVVRLRKDSLIEGCFPFARALWFDRFNDGLTVDGKKDLDAFASRVAHSAKATRLEVKDVTVTGHADRTPVLDAKDNNLDLSRRRAKNVAEALQKAWVLGDEHVHVFGVGSRDSTTPCASTLDREAMSDCLSPDRRVDVRVVLAPEHKDEQGEKAATTSHAIAGEGSSPPPTNTPR
jgi:OmpA-OmpF porin, OOP family